MMSVANRLRRFGRAHASVPTDVETDETRCDRRLKAGLNWSLESFCSSESGGRCFPLSTLPICSLPSSYSTRMWATSRSPRFLSLVHRPDTNTPSKARISTPRSCRYHTLFARTKGSEGAEEVGESASTTDVCMLAESGVGRDDGPSRLPRPSSPPPRCRASLSDSRWSQARLPGVHFLPREPLPGIQRPKPRHPEAIVASERVPSP